MFLSNSTRAKFLTNFDKAQRNTIKLYEYLIDGEIVATVSGNDTVTVSDASTLSVGDRILLGDLDTTIIDIVTNTITLAEAPNVTESKEIFILRQILNLNGSLPLVTRVDSRMLPILGMADMGVNILYCARIARENGQPEPKIGVRYAVESDLTPITPLMAVKNNVEASKSQEFSYLLYLTT